MKYIQIRGGHRAIVDEKDCEFLSQFNWCLNSGGYAVTSKDGKTVSMHRRILGANKGEIVDHLNHRPRDNRRENLRVVTVRQNALNKRPYKNCPRGVRWDRRRKKFIVHVRVSGWMFYRIGEFDSRKEAQERYEKALSVSP